MAKSGFEERQTFRTLISRMLKKKKKKKQPSGRHICSFESQQFLKLWWLVFHPVSGNGVRRWVRHWGTPTPCPRNVAVWWYSCVSRRV